MSLSCHSASQALRAASSPSIPRRPRPARCRQPPPPAPSAPSDLCRLVSALVAAQAALPADVLLAHRRCRAPVAAARQLAMYVAHVGLGMAQSDVARGFLRDRTTVAHACRRVEDLRDDPAFDHQVARLEACARWAVGL